MSEQEKYIKAAQEQFHLYSSEKNVSKLLKFINFIEKHQDSTSIQDDDIAEAHIIVAEKYSSENNIDELLHLIKAIKYQPEDLKLREEYLTSFLFYLNRNKEKWLVKELQLFKKEFLRYLEYCLMKWGKEKKLYYPILHILERIESLEKQSVDSPEGPLSSFCDKWQNVTAKYRPVEQAFDYASQIIYENATNKGNEI